MRTTTRLVAAYCESRGPEPVHPGVVVALTNAMTCVEAATMPAAECQIGANGFPILPDVLVDRAVHGRRVGPPVRPVLRAIPWGVSEDPALDCPRVRIPQHRNVRTVPFLGMCSMAVVRGVVGGDVELRGFVTEPVIPIHDHAQRDLIRMRRRRRGTLGGTAVLTGARARPPCSCDLRDRLLRLGHIRGSMRTRRRRFTAVASVAIRRYSTVTGSSAARRPGPPGHGVTGSAVLSTVAEDIKRRPSMRAA